MQYYSKSIIIFRFSSQCSYIKIKRTKNRMFFVATVPVYWISQANESGSHSCISVLNLYKNEGSHLKHNRGTHFFYQFTLRKYTIMSTDPTAGVAKCEPICSQHLKGIDRASGG